MIPGLGGGMNPKQMASVMKQMGMKTVEIEASRVIVEKSDGSKMIVEKPSVTIVEFSGQKMMQVAGAFSESGEGEGAPQGSDSNDAEMVARQAHVPLAKAQQALDNAGGDIAQAIMDLQEEK